jgi:UDP-N-acetylglucosamine--N-acetylmuramyl-(pentapeptide) pyrophosphoryl-undecaprenol N-acetylglucosamine transferase
MVELFYVGPNDAYSAVLGKAGLKMRYITVGKLRRYFSLQNILDIPKFFVSLIQAFVRMFALMPDAVFSKGGPGALPVVMAAWFYRIPVVIHESDAAPGLTNLLSRPFAARVAVSFPETARFFKQGITACTGSPVRKDLSRGRMDQAAAKEALGFDPHEPLLLVIVGSQGSRRINEFILSGLAAILKDMQVLHQTGRGNFMDVEKLSRAALADVPVGVETKHPYKAVPYFEGDLATAYSAADLVVSRAGSQSIFEIASFGKPAILIPLSDSANNHQRANAYEFAKGGGAIVLEEANLLPGIFAKQAREIIAAEKGSGRMAMASSDFFKPQAGAVIAEEIYRLAS